MQRPDFLDSPEGVQNNYHIAHLHTHRLILYRVIHIHSICTFYIVYTWHSMKNARTKYLELRAVIFIALISLNFLHAYVLNVKSE